MLSYRYVLRNAYRGKQIGRGRKISYPEDDVEEVAR